MNKDLNSWVKCCLPCQESKITRHTKSQYGIFKTPSGRFLHIHMDLVGPLPQSNGHTYIITLIDRFSRWPEAIPLTGIHSRKRILALMDLACQER